MRRGQSATEQTASPHQSTLANPFLVCVPTECVGLFEPEVLAHLVRLLGHAADPPAWRQGNPCDFPVQRLYPPDARRERVCVCVCV